MWRNLAYGSQQAAEAAPAVVPIKSVKETVVSQVDASSVPKNDGAKVYKILEFLRKVPMHMPVSVTDIFKHTGVDLTMDDQVEQRLKNNPKVRLKGDQYAYQAKYDIKNRMQLLKILDRIPEGMPIEDLIDCYVNVEDDLKELTRTGEIICLKNADKGAEVYYSRVVPFLVDLSGVATVEAGSYLAHSSQDLTGEVRRGDAFRIGDNWFRVSAAVKVRVIIHVLVLNNIQLKCTVVYMFKFDKDHLPLDVPFPDAKRRNVASSDRWDLLPKRGPKFQMVKHGCTNDIRQLWRDTLRTWPSDRAEFEKKLVQAGLTTQAKVDASRRQMKRRLKEDKKKNRPRKQRDIKITNHHLIGTKLGEILAKGSQEQFTLGAVKFEKK
ncbi:Ubiquitin-conjugating enzyme E2 N [Phytophthora nicotianae]|uniref:Ubiquitin-conjugating enzyme E2 N n=1 Tax=Phytophthora nicotianae TaxID=4792 RepID=A0A0W8DKN2_PHYNI|nr:Ubiquitin-conjugating enzyme E2 N [Phytophthora nicotianae]